MLWPEVWVMNYVKPVWARPGVVEVSFCYSFMQQFIMKRALCHKITAIPRCGRTERRILSTPWIPAIWPGSTASRIDFPSQKNPSYHWKSASISTKATPTTSSVAMETTADEVVVDSPAHFRIYKSGRIERLNRPPILPAGLDEATGVTSKDVVLDAGTGLSARLYLPKLQETSKKLPVLVYFHGGAFLLETADSATYHTYVNPLAAAAGVLVVSVSYRLAPEHPLPAAYEDSWAALRWAASAQDEWVAEHGDAARLFLAGDSAGANIVHDMLLRASGDAAGPRIEGAIMLHPWFGGNTPMEGEPKGASAATAGLWMYACPGAVGGADDPRMNPLAPGAPSLEKLACARMLVCAGKKDGLYVRDRAYYEAVAASAWPGDVAWHESEDEEHVFFLPKPECENAKQLMDRVVAFIAGD